MIITEKLENGLVKVTSSTGLVQIAEEPVKAVICSEAEVEYVTEISK